ncbi:MAG: ABC transporter substrate-binding protein [Dehalococcoidia bacterium]|nr:ABC transporter substrate-binding protein [Dehalococcoidia bacterium]
MPPRDYTTPTLDPVEDITRRRLLTALPALGLIAGGISCGDDDESTPTSAPAEASLFPRTIAHSAGETTVPARPERVVALKDFNDLDYLLTLGVEPVAYGFTNAWESGSMPWQSAASEIQTFDASGEVDLEAVAATNPDLIVTMPVGEDVYAQLGEIAPTIVLDWGTPWREGLRWVAAGLGEERAEEAIDGVASRLDAMREALDETTREKKLMVGFMYGDTLYVWGTKVQAMVVFSEMGLNAVSGPEPELASLSLEQANVLEQAEILLSVASDPEAIATQEASPLFRQLPAVQSGGYDVLPVAESRALGDGFSPLSIEWVQGRIVERLNRLAAGRGKQLT